MTNISRTISTALLAGALATSLYGCVTLPSSSMLEASLNPPYLMPSDPTLVADVNAARPMLNKLLQAIACERDPYNRSRLVPFATPDSPMTWFANPKIGMRHHRSGCLTVLSVEDWQRVAFNAIRFSAKFVSPESGEGALSIITLYRQRDGRWLAYL